MALTSWRSPRRSVVVRAQDDAPLCGGSRPALGSLRTGGLTVP